MRDKKGRFTSAPRLEKRNRVKLECPICDKKFEVKGYRIKGNKDICCSISCANTLKFTGKEKPKFGKATWFWKDNSARYRTLHKRVYKMLGRPRRCDLCKRDKVKFYWANKSGYYLLKENDWISLCAKCHWTYDHA